MMGLSMSAWLFGAAVLILMLLAWIFLLWPLLRKRDYETGVSRRQTNIDLYRMQVAELDQAVSLGEISAEDAELQKRGFSRQLLISTEGTDEAAPKKTGQGAWLFVLAAAFVPVFAIFIYLQGEGWRLLNADSKSPPWDFIIHRAQAKLEANPEDQETWTFLARSYRALERYPESASAYANLNRLNGGTEPDLLVEEGEMIALVDEGNMRGTATEKFLKALEINPAHGRALWYAGLAALQREDNAVAVSYWQQLARQELPESFRLVLDRQLKRLGAETPSPAAGPAMPPVIRVRVEAAPELIRNLPPQTPVFIYARAINGPRQPLAAKRITVANLPADVVLDDSMAMAGGAALSAQEAWTVTARVSLAGGAASQSGDPVGNIELLKADALKGRPLRIEQRWQP